MVSRRHAATTFAGNILSSVTWSAAERFVAGRSATARIEIDMGITFPGTAYVITLEIDGPVLLGSIHHETNGDMKSLSAIDAKFNVEPNRSTPFVGLRIGANTTDKVKLFSAEIR